MEKQRQHITNETAIFSLWLNWAVSIFALSLPTFIALFAPKIWMPVIVLGIMLLLTAYRGIGGKSVFNSCDLISVITIRSLGISAVIMLLIAIIYVRGYISMFFEPHQINTDIPFLSILIIAPVTAFICLYHIIAGPKSGVCRECVIKNGPYSERGFIGRVLRHEGKFQVRLLLGIASGLCVIDWFYYWFFYINVNINSLDRLMINWIPTIVYTLSTIYMGMRCFSIWGYYYKNIKLSPTAFAEMSGVRYLIICGEKIFLSRSDIFNDIPDANMLDTPATVFISNRDTFDLREARRTFNDLSNIADEHVAMRFMYKSSDTAGTGNIFHFISCLDSEEAIAGSMLRGEWYGMSQLQRLLDNREVTPLLAAELHRLYTVAMAWKTYDISGKRLYKIKNYRPKFRLKGICEWDVDFNSPQWLEVAQFNEDKRFFHLRRLLRRRSKA